MVMSQTQDLRMEWLWHYNLADRLVHKTSTGNVRVVSSGWSSVIGALISHLGGELGGSEELMKESLRSIKSPNVGA